MAQARSASTPAFGLKAKATPAPRPAATSAARLSRTANRSNAACVASQAAPAYQAGYGMLKDAKSPAKKGRKAA